MHDKYFEGIVQLRDCDEKDAEWMESILLEEAGIFQIKIVRGGLDFYVRSKKPLRTLMRYMKEKGCEVKFSKKLHTKNHMTNKEVYRVNLLVRMPKIKVGDVLTAGHEVVLVSSFGKKIIGTDLRTGTRRVLDKYDKILETKETTISKIKPNIEVLHPETFQSTKVENPDFYDEKKHSKKLNVLDYKGRVYIV